ncbi:dipeptidase [Halomarina rubra]|uniref:Dipeptidase n=1 Tax=Halomarina rubra TaxID=2071873 RepID=A0ABD6ARV3_9EURY|nr:dipeptidase [Halomarina rubra]
MDYHRLFDGHNDTLLDLHLDERGGGRSFFERSAEGHVDLPRAREAGFGGGLFAIFVPYEERPEFVETDEGYEMPLADQVDTERAKRFTFDVLARLYRLERRSAGDLRVCRSAVDVREAWADEALAAVAHLEGAAAVEPDLSNLDLLYAAGVRSIGLTWARPNAFATGAQFAYPRDPDVGPGLTDAGVELVRACEERGILVDCAHLTAAGFWDVAATTRAPLVVSHAAVHDICPSTRNLTDEQLDAIGESDGVVGISLAVENLRADGDRVLDTPVSVVADHVEYVAERIGVEHVALGSDFDGCTVPETVGDVTGLRAILDELHERGFERRDFEQFCSENWLRVLAQTGG